MTSKPVAPVRHGGLVHDELAALGISSASILDFSVNVNPYGPCDEVRRAVSAAPIDRYPDPTAAPARRALGTWLGVSPGCLVVGNGAVDVLWSAARALLKPSDTVVIAEPAFSEMRVAAELVGARVAEWRAAPADHFAFHARAFESVLRAEKPKLVYLATPANPSGAGVGASELLALAEAHPTIRFVFDVSFAGLGDRAPEFDLGRVSQHGFANVVWLVSLTKELSVPGVRVGFGVGPVEWIREIQAQMPPWSVSAPAQAVAMIAAQDSVRRFVEMSRARLASDRRHLHRRLVGLGLAPSPSEAPYLLVHLGARTTGSSLRRALLERHGILVRDATSFGLPDHVRLAARPEADVARLIHALEEELP